MATNDGRVPVLNLNDTLELYYGLLEKTKEMEQEVRLLRDRILHSLSERGIAKEQVDGYDVERQIRHHPPQLNEDLAIEILAKHGRLAECQVEVLDQEKAREVIDQLFRHGALTKNELPFIYVKPTEALVVRQVEAVARPAQEIRRVRPAA